jgi:hypothetical protein
MSRTMRGFAGLVAALGLFGLASVSIAQESPVPKPAPEHERLARDVGTWDATIKNWMQGPGSEPSVSKGVEVAKMMPGGFWVLSEFRSEFGDTAYYGQGQTGYDPVKKKYIGTWAAGRNQPVGHRPTPQMAGVRSSRPLASPSSSKNSSVAWITRSRSRSSATR